MISTLKSSRHPFMPRVTAIFCL